MPDHHLHTPLTLAHANRHIRDVGRILSDYLLPGPFTLEYLAAGNLAQVRVTAVVPLPASVALSIADVLTQLRSAIEHAVFAEVEHQLERRLTADEARRVEMPAATTEEAFDKWLKSSKRPELAPLVAGSTLVERMRSLQPFNDGRPDDHPLRALAEHTNFTKHRAPAVAAVRLDVVVPDGASAAEQRALFAKAATEHPAPLRPGDVLATGPLYEQVDIDIWPQVSLQRPHSGTWRVVMHELAELERWVRTLAVPHLIAGDGDVDELPPWLDTTVGHSDVRAALTASDGLTGFEQSSRRMQAIAMRPALSELLVRHPRLAQSGGIASWTNTLTDNEVLQIWDQLAVVARQGDPMLTAAIVSELIEQAWRPR